MKEIKDIVLLSGLHGLAEGLGITLGVGVLFLIFYLINRKSNGGN